MEANMLVLGRKVGESIYVGDDIKIMLIATSGEKARIGIEAPKSISILREELKKTQLPTTQSQSQSL
jgi:carbon storage regulator